MAIEDLSTGLIDRAKARIGTVLREKWRLDRLLGIGGMAAVYAATHRNGSRGAIKMLHTELSIDAEVKRRFLREGYVANAVEHPGTVKVLDDDVADDGSVFIVMELLEGETLEARAERQGGRIPPGELLPLIDQLLDVLAVAHTRGVVHRDIKPENVFVTTAGTVKLLDFGIAKLRRGQGSMATVTGSTFGTPAFMPPEQALGRTDEVEARSDLWSVGAAMFNLLAGRVIHETQTLNEQLVAHAAKPAPSLATAAPNLAPGLVSLVDHALAFEKSGRWQSAAEMQWALRRVMAELKQVAPEPVAFANTVAMPSFPDYHPSPASPQAMASSGLTGALGPPAQLRPATVPGAAAPSPLMTAAPALPVAPSVASVTVHARPAPGAQLPPKRSQVLLGAAIGALVVLVFVLIAGRKLRGTPTTAADAQPTATAVATSELAPPPSVAPATVTPEPVTPPTVVPAETSAPTATASASAPRPPAATPPPPPPTPTPPPTAKPKATATPKPGKGDWLDRQH